jgi:serine/threonine protein kinase
MWSFGVILYILLGGYPPFHHDNQRELFKKIVRGDFEFHPHFWGSVSEEAKDLIRGLLTTDPVKRLTVEQALAHPWLMKSGAELESRNLDDNLKTLRKYHNTRKLKAGVKAIMAVNKMKFLMSEKRAAMTTDIEKVADEAIREGKSVEVPHILSARYSLGEKLGEGGYSIVKEGFNKVTNEKVAVKIITRKGLKPDEVVALKKEIRILQALDHENIVRAVDFFDEADNFYVVMECIEGGELFDRIVAKSYYNEKEARDLVILLLQVIQYCHSINIIHRYNFTSTTFRHIFH